MARKPKSPQEKKVESYEHDRRNTYGENAKSSRKNVRRNKGIERRVERRGANQALVAVDRATSSDVADSMQTAATERHRRRFKKLPDQPLGVVVPRKLQRRAAGAGAKKRRAAGRLEAKRRTEQLVKEREKAET